jgi:hypothetical protein
VLTQRRYAGLFSEQLAADVRGARVTNDDRDEHSEAENDLVRFFRGLRPSARAEYALLAGRDREFGENVVAEHRAQAEKGGA